ncbi:cyclic pyranopterin monophosphate synthase MoaC [Methanoplanus endosymbiosus]|uniref:Probable cyclic pyranopterin monophosphate synthase n=1 Tax=Methanoplanus endosymbiosus TaxID=33865 RepID=A0A9E7PNL7_9EURY|nr:cyclic pyranopterin monophosphate synthase MoaC [Methanoplanus endosymbiosus]UUX92016.1 cyclic pyranopterin monophosphate synthase MoaC [Methanoplanus endosymbiosus]
MPEFTHIENDRASMVDISEKKDVSRQATAGGRIYLRPETLDAIKNGAVIKGNVLSTARVAGIMAAKHTSTLIPMCHPIPVSSVSIDFEFGEENCIEAKCTAKTFGSTGIEMEALTGVSVALLTVWDMVKSAEKDENGQYPETGIEDVHVIEKIKG